MPQPMDNLPRNTVTNTGVGVMDRISSDLIELVGRIVGLWSIVDIELTHLCMLCADHDRVEASLMLSEIDRHPTARKLFVSFTVSGRFRGHPDDLALVEKVLARAWGLRDLRNQLAHQYWAAADDRPDILVLLPPKRIGMKRGLMQRQKDTRPAQDLTITTEDGTSLAFPAWVVPPEENQALPEPPRANYCTKRELKSHVRELDSLHRMVLYCHQLLAPEETQVQQAREWLSQKLPT